MSGCGCACPIALPPLQAQFNVSASETQVLVANNNRVNATVQNFGTVPVYVYFTTGGQANAPYILLQGQTWNALQTGWLNDGPVYVVTGSSTSVVGVCEETART